MFNVRSWPNLHPRDRVTHTRRIIRLLAIFLLAVGLCSGVVYSATAADFPADRANIAPGIEARAPGPIGASASGGATSAGESTASGWLVHWLINPVVGALLFSLGTLLIVGSLIAGDLGIVTVLGVAALALFFWGHIQADLAGWEGIALALVGLILIGAEVVVIPGFGLAGILGGAALLAALLVSVTGEELPTPVAAERAITSAAIALVAVIVGGGIGLRYLPAVARRRGLVLLSADSPFHFGGRGDEFAREQRDLAADPRPSLAGARGQALAELRPGGFALIDGERVDVITRGEIIPAGATVEIVRDDGYRRIVRRVAPEEPDIEGL